MKTKTLRKIGISALMASVIFVLLYVSLESGENKVENISVVMVKKDIDENDKIDPNDLELVSMPENIGNQYVRDIALVSNKFAKDKLYKGQYVRAENIKAVAASKKATAETRTVRVATNVAAYAGAGKGDIVDLIYVGKIGALETIGRYFYQNLEVKAVLNKSGIDLEKLTTDKYNQADQEPGFIDFEVPATVALEISTLQGETNNVCFKLAVWEDESKPVTDPGFRKSYELIYGGSKTKVITESPKTKQEKPAIQIKTSK